MDPSFFDRCGPYEYLMEGLLGIVPNALRNLKTGCREVERKLKSTRSANPPPTSMIEHGDRSHLRDALAWHFLNDPRRAIRATQRVVRTTGSGIKTTKVITSTMVGGAKYRVSKAVYPLAHCVERRSRARIQEYEGRRTRR